MKKNFVYNFIYQFTNIILPFITIPYISRVLGPEGIGKYSLANTYSQYFILFGMLGLTMYSSRQIAYIRDNEEELKKNFYELNLLRFITVGIVLIIYIIVFFIFNLKEDFIYKIQILMVLASLVDISWLFIGLENFKKVLMRNIIIKISSFLLIFILIKDSNDVWIYGLILAGSQFVGQLIMWLDVPFKIRIYKIRKSNLLNHLKFSLLLFIPQLAMQVYTMLDRVMLGTMVGEYEVGLYDNSQKMVKVIATLATSIITITIPRMSNLYAKNDIDNFRKIAYKSFSFISFICFPMAFGLIAIAKNFVPWFYGEQFLQVEGLFYISAWLIITLGWSSVLGNQILICIKKEKKLTIAVFIGAGVNLILNLLLLTKYKSFGATISSVIAEFTGMFIMTYFIREILDIKELFKSVPKYFISSIIMCSIVWIIGLIIEQRILCTLVQLIVGGLVYIGIMVLVKDSNLVYSYNIVKNKLKNKDNIKINKTA